MKKIKNGYRKFKNGIKNLVDWLPIIWQDRDWDEEYLLAVMEFKFQRMADYHEKNSDHTTAKETVAQLKRCVELSQRLQGLHYNKEVGDLCRKGLLVEAFHLAEKQEKEDLQELSELIRDHLASWWD